jgi:N-methylhydantoinase A
LDASLVLNGYAALFGLLRHDAAADDVDPQRIQFRRYLDMRYRNEGTEITVPLEDVEAIDPAVIGARFHEAHDTLYGYRQIDETITVVSLRVKAFAPPNQLTFADLASAFRRHHAQSSLETDPPRVRIAHFGKYGSVSTPVVSRASLLKSPRLGPAIIEESDTAIVVPPNWTATLDDLANVVLTTRS